MASWSEMAEHAPEIAAVGQALLDKHGLAYLATVRADGSPRVHPVCPFVIGGRLIVASSEGRMASVAIADGKVSPMPKIGNPVYQPPVVANNMLYILDAKGNLTAWR